MMKRSDFCLIKQTRHVGKSHLLQTFTYGRFTFLRAISYMCTWRQFDFFLIVDGSVLNIYNKIGFSYQFYVNVNVHLHNLHHAGVKEAFCASKMVFNVNAYFWYHFSQKHKNDTSKKFLLT